MFTSVTNIEHLLTSNSVAINLIALSYACLYLSITSDLILWNIFCNIVCNKKLSIFDTRDN